MGCIGYIRVSTEGQEASGLGLEAQEAKIRAYADLYGLEVVEIISDAASGKSIQRCGLQRALASLKAGKADGLIVAKLDRLTRSVSDMGALLEGYFASKASLYAVGEQIDTGTAAGRMVLNILISVAQWEREAIGERTKDALQAKIQRGERTGSLRYGFKMATDGVHLEEEPTEQLVIAEAKALRTAGLSMAAIGQALAERGFKSRNGRIFHSEQIRRILAA